MTDPAVDTPLDATAEPGLRERKRLATRRAILLAAITVVREKGLEAATVDEIARIADVSPRTFFNYFSSKEEAIVGDGPELPDQDAQDAFVKDRGPILPGLASLFAHVITPALQDQEVILLRRAITKENPEIGGRRWASIHRFEGELTGLLARRLADEDPALARDQRALTSRARMTAFVAISAMRHAWLDW
ncbi:MAG: helix-turn-helix domain-containing protein, partial [Rhodoglobus sp.]